MRTFAPLLALVAIVAWFLLTPQANKSSIDEAMKTASMGAVVGLSAARTAAAPLRARFDPQPPAAPGAAEHDDGGPWGSPLCDGPTTVIGYDYNDRGHQGPSWDNGVDLGWAGMGNESLCATFSGTIERGSQPDICGTYVYLRGNGWSALYCHMDHYADSAPNGASVVRGTIIGYAGATGRVSGIHVHYSLVHNGQGVNPHERGCLEPW